jgi:putative oxidoreductase
MGAIQGLVSLVGRLLLGGIFFAAAVMNHIPHFSSVTDYMKAEGVPAPQIMHVGAIAFLLLGSISLIVGYKARWGAAMLAVFLVLASYYIHDFWTVADAAQAQQQQVHFMKNMAMLGGMLFILANGAGAWSIDGCRKCHPLAESKPKVFPE